jgi:hypothetical protein
MDAIAKTVTFKTLDDSETIELINPSNPYTVIEYNQGSTKITPTGNKITQVLYTGYRISLTWEGLDRTIYETLKDFIERFGYEGFIFHSPDEIDYKCVVDGLNSFTSTLKYFRQAGKLRYSVALKLVTIP